MINIGISVVMDKKIKYEKIPLEINDHFMLFGKEPWEIDYNEKCPVCETRIDEFGFCSCGAGSD